MAHTALERSLPSDIEAERAILGAILLDNSVLDDVGRKLDPAHFFHAHHRRIFDQMLNLAEGRGAIDLVTLTDQLHRTGDLENAGGAAYIAQLMDGVPHVTNVAHYAAIVKEKALLRGLVHAANAIGQQAIEAELPAEEVLERAEQAINQLGETRAVTELLALRDVISSNEADFERILTSSHAITGLPSGYMQLDTLLCGLQPGNVVILAARPSIGKTAMALNIAQNVALAGKSAALFSLEMSRREILQRLLASTWRRDLRKLRAGGMSRQDWGEVKAQLAELSKLPLYIDDANPTTVSEIAAKARYLKRRSGLDLVIVDYLQLVSGATRAKYTNRNEEVGASSRAFKAMARNLDVPVIVLSQLTRSPEKDDRPPKLSDLRESGAIEQDADVVIFIHRPKAFASGESAEERNKTQVIVAKQRNGPTESIGFAFLAAFTRFEETAPEFKYE